MANGHSQQSTQGTGQVPQQAAFAQPQQNAHGQRWLAQTLGRRKSYKPD
jgi:hypothetical protein